MPAILSHDFFGRDMLERIPGCDLWTQDERDAFLLGNQGPDPLFYLVLNPRLARSARLGNTMHHDKPAELLSALKDSLCVATDDEVDVARAYALGFLCHYTLDSQMHPLVFSVEYALCDAGVPELDRNNGSEVHGVIESEFDEMVLWNKLGITIADYAPTDHVLLASDRVLDIISKMYAYMALVVYGRQIEPGLFAAAVRSFRRGQSLFYSPTGSKRAALSRVEELVRPYSLFRSMSHRAAPLESSQFANNEHDTWENPFTGEERDESFDDIFAAALERATSNAALFLSPDFDRDAARTLTGDLNFSGEPWEAVLEPDDEDVA